jgi:phosphoribosylanthranilate isomerase
MCQLSSPGSPWIKVCGARSFSDLELCAAAGATHAGINPWPGSPRSVAPRRVAELVGAARSVGLASVLLILPGSPLGFEEILRLAPDYVQALDTIPASLVRRFAGGGTGVVEARRLGPNNAGALPWGDVLLLDARLNGRPGGTGVRAPEDLVRRSPRPFVLAGGLGPDNVAGAIVALGPAGVDAASGLESAPGVKDPGRVRAFCGAARTAFEAARRGE